MVRRDQHQQLPLQTSNAHMKQVANTAAELKVLFFSTCFLSFAVSSFLLLFRQHKQWSNGWGKLRKCCYQILVAQLQLLLRLPQ
jgi:hypothetical protein